MMIVGSGLRFSATLYNKSQQIIWLAKN